MDKKIYTSRQVKKFATDFVNYLKQEHGLIINSAYIFGSYAKKKPKNWSDIDVCIVSPKFNRTDPLVYLWRRRRDIDTQRGIEPYGIAPDGFHKFNPIASEVKKYGIKI